MKVIQLCPTLSTSWTIQSMEFSRPEYCSGYPFTSPGDLPNPGIKPRSPAMQEDSLPAESQRKPTRPSRYDLNQIPYDYTCEMTNKFKGLDLIDRVPEELRTEVHDMLRRQGSKPSSRKRNTKRQNVCLRRSYK